VYWIDYYVSGRRKRERIGPDKRLAETVFRKRKVEIAEGKFLDKRKVPRCSFNELALLYLDSDHVFPGKTGNGLVDIRKRCRWALAEADMEGFVFYDLRHTFASHLVMSGVDLMTVKEFLGHKDIKMTLRYAHLAPDYKRSAISRLDTYMDTSHKKGITAYAVTP